MKNSSFRTFAETVHRFTELGNEDAKTEVCAQYLESMSSERDVARAVRFMGEGPFPAFTGKRISIASRTVAVGASEYCEIDYERVFKPCKEALGDIAETIGKLMHNLESVRSKRTDARLSLAQVEEEFERLSDASTRAQKQEILFNTWSKMTPLEVKYFLRIMRGSLVDNSSDIPDLPAALAKAFGKEIEQIRHVCMITGSIGKAAELSFKDQLEKAGFRLFQPIPFMLASPLEGEKPPSESHDYVAEELLDGLRCQLHVKGGDVRLFSRCLDDVSHVFPEVEQSFNRRSPSDMVLDGILCGVKNKQLLPGHLVRKRQAGKTPGQKLLGECPAMFVACDVLYYGGQEWSRQVWTKRRSMLESLANDYDLPIPRQYGSPSSSQLPALLDRALLNGSLGLILKNKNGTYEYGQRSNAWLKWKRPAGRISTMLMYAHRNTSHPDQMCTEFTLGVCVREDPRYQETFIPITRSVKGLASEQIQEINKRLPELTAEKYGSTYGLFPKIGIEVVFDEIRINNRTKAKYVLRNAIAKSVIWEPPPEAISTLKDVEELYQTNIKRGELIQDRHPSILF